MHLACLGARLVRESRPRSGQRVALSAGDGWCGREWLVQISTPYTVQYLYVPTYGVWKQWSIYLRLHGYTDCVVPRWAPCAPS